MASWSARLGQKQNILPQTTPLKIVQSYEPSQQVKPKKTKPDIPDYVRFEKEIDSDDDMIIHGNVEGIAYLKYQRQLAMKMKKKDVVITNDDEIVLNHFNTSERVFLFKFISVYLSMSDCIDFLTHCQKYCKIMNTDSELLYFWKFLYEREQRHIHRKHKRKKRTSKHVWLAKHKRDMSNYKYFENCCRYMMNQRHLFTVKYDSQSNHITFNSENSHVPIMRRSSIIIITDPSELNNASNSYLRLGRLEICTSGSNWYDAKCVLGAGAAAYNRKPLRHNPYKKGTRRHKEYSDNYCHGYKQLKVDLLIGNINISEIFGNRKYDIKVVSYIEYECYLVGILPFDSLKGDDDKKRRCKVSYSYKNKECNIQMIHNVEFKAIILTDMMDVDELECTLNERKDNDKRLKVLVYGLEGGYSHKSRRKYEFISESYFKPEFVVIDYFQRINE